MLSDNLIYNSTFPRIIILSQGASSAGCQVTSEKDPKEAEKKHMFMNRSTQFTKDRETTAFLEASQICTDTDKK